ncbi:MAG: hypothetical protein LUC34_05350 [Campylobacter sp.]|nr:hypothetical protein [Campylobacter sp.]
MFSITIKKGIIATGLILMLPNMSVAGVPVSVVGDATVTTWESMKWVEKAKEWAETAKKYSDDAQAWANQKAQMAAQLYAMSGVMDIANLPKGNQ